MLEKEVERKFVKRAKDAGGAAYKFVSPGRIGVPDRLVLAPIPPEHRAIVSMYVKFVELKKPGETPRPSQIREHNRLKRMGYSVYVVDK